MGKSRVFLLSGLVFILALGIGAAFVRLQERNREDTERRAVTEIGLARSSALEKQVDRCFAAAYALSLAIDPSGRVDDFAAIADRIRTRFSALGSLAVVRDSTRPQVHPPSGLSAVAVNGDGVGGVEEAADPEEIARAAARQSGRFTLAGPFPRGRNGLVLFGYLPVRGEEIGSREGWSGLVIVAVRVPELVEASGLGGLAARGYDYQLSHRDSSPTGRSIVFVRSTELEIPEPVEMSVTVPGGPWTLAIAPRAGWRSSSSGSRNTGLVLVLALLVTLVSYDLSRRPEVLRREVEIRTRRLALANRNVMKEIVERERTEQKLLHEASHDRLTGLPNRPYFLSRVGRALERFQRDPKKQFAVLLIDLDRFNSINDSLGPVNGDRLLVAMGERLTGCLGPEATAGRVDGDEFGLLCSDLWGIESVATIAERLGRVVAEPFLLDGREVLCTASIGIALSSPDYAQPEELLRDADLSLQRAKIGGGARYAIFERGMHERAVESMVLESELRRAIERNELRVFYQPIVSLRDGRIAGFEALARWLHPERGFVSPAIFIPLAESTDLIFSIDRWVWTQACRRIRALQQRLPKERTLSISVNLSARQLGQGDLVDKISEVLRGSSLPARSFRLEITESMMMENAESALAVLSRLKSLDISLVLDDFGTGYSSLSYLHDLPIDVLKIDRSFINRLTSDTKHAEIVRTILLLGRGLGMEVVAEGVETAQHLAYLRALECTYGQGTFFSEPVPEEKLQSLVTTNRRW
jgi:diguanylate cyclase (GGDEF)-like protein